MYKKGTALELQFCPARLNSQAGDPYWIDLSLDEARRLRSALDAYLSTDRDSIASPLVVALDHDPATDTQDTQDAQDNQSTQPRPSAPVLSTQADDALKQWVCLICGWIYDEAEGDPEHGVAAGTRWHDIPEDWRCPLCDVGKDDFALVEF